MKKTILKVFTIISISLFFIGSIFILITNSGSTFSDTYQSVIQRKYSLLKTNEKKIIIVGGSSAGFGINSPMLESKTEYKVINLGLHAGFGPLFNTEISKANINEEDIIILAHEYIYSTQDVFDQLGDVKLIMSGIDSNIAMYKNIPIKQFPKIVGNLYEYATYKYGEHNKGIGAYSPNAFDEQGNMLYQREGYVIKDYHGKVDYYKNVDITKSFIHESNVEYLNKYKEFVESKGAKVYFAAPPLLKDAAIGKPEEFTNYAKDLESKTGIKFISDPNEYIFPEEYMYDTIYHCNTAGEMKRTELLYKDILPYLGK